MWASIRIFSWKIRTYLCRNSWASSLKRNWLPKRNASCTACGLRKKSRNTAVQRSKRETHAALLRRDRSLLFMKSWPLSLFLQLNTSWVNRICLLSRAVLAVIFGSWDTCDRDEARTSLGRAEPSAEYAWFHLLFPTALSDGYYQVCFH